jgi:hypothetical protein
LQLRLDQLLLPLELREELLLPQGLVVQLLQRRRRRALGEQLLLLQRRHRRLLEEQLLLLQRRRRRALEEHLLLLPLEEQQL